MEICRVGIHSLKIKRIKIRHQVFVPLYLFFFNWNLDKFADIT